MRICFTAVFCFIFLPLFSQDYIYKVDNTRIAAKIFEIYPYDVKYRLYNNPDTALYIMDKDIIALIVYENGTYDMFSLKNVKRKRKVYSDSLATFYKKNILAFNLFEVLLNNVSLSYERILWRGKLGIRLPVIFSAGYTAINENYQKHWGTGADVNFYPNGQGKAKFFIGTSLETGQYKNTMHFFSNTIRTEYKKYLLMMVNNGFSFQITPQLNIAVSGSVVIRQNSGSMRTESTIKASYHIGFRF